MCAWNIETFQPWISSSDWCHNEHQAVPFEPFWISLISQSVIIIYSRALSPDLQDRGCPNPSSLLLPGKPQHRNLLCKINGQQKVQTLVLPDTPLQTLSAWRKLRDCKNLPWRCFQWHHALGSAVLTVAAVPPSTATPQYMYVCMCTSKIPTLVTILLQNSTI
jgi:hypothetical protein